MSEIGAMLAVSRRVAAGGPLSAILDAISAEAARVVEGARGTGIMLVTGGRGRLRLAGSHGLSPGYGERLRDWPVPHGIGQGGSGLALQEQATVVIEDSDGDERFRPWRELARMEGYRSVVSVPLLAGGASIGALNAYRASPGAWAPEQLELLRFFAQHAASAVQTAQLLDRQAEQVVALRRLIRTLEEQTHEHANRLHAVSGLLALGELDEAGRFLESVETLQRDMRASLVERVRHPILAGLLMAEAAIALQRNIALDVDPETAIERMPSSVSDSQVITIVGNLLDNAFDAVAEMAPERRRVRFRATADDQRTIIEVRDWGKGIAPGSEGRLLERGVSSKRDHVGVGLTLVQEAARAAMGRLDVRRHSDGVAMIVSLPHA
jgi:GAF domain-containing protein/anti-sigma regulatory factor (Ser/Thr protein kinase)